MNYLITGFTGPHLANLLIGEKHEVYGLIRASNGTETDILDIVEGENFPKTKFFYGDITDRLAIHNLFQDHQFDSVFHLVAQSHPPLYCPFDVCYQHGDTTDIKEITDWKPEINIMTTLFDLLNYWINKIQC